MVAPTLHVLNGPLVGRFGSSFLLLALAQELALPSVCPYLRDADAKRIRQMDGATVRSMTRDGTVAPAGTASPSRQAGSAPRHPSDSLAGCRSGSVGPDAGSVAGHHLALPHARLTSASSDTRASGPHIVPSPSAPRSCRRHRRGAQTAHPSFSEAALRLICTHMHRTRAHTISQ
eukprot:COSAG01_NODE_12967_length_1656_cov_1.391779_2_plen_175_part_00